MHLIILVLACIGAIWLLCVIVLPIIEAIIFGHITHVLSLLNIEWRKTKWSWKVIRYVLFHQWINTRDRLVGLDMYTTELTIGNWWYEPPFKLRRFKQHDDKGVADE